MANDPRPGLTPVETPCGQAMARNAGGMALSMICIQVCIEYVYSNPVKPTGNLTQLYKKLRMPGIYQVELRPTWGRSPQVSSMARFWRPLIWGTVLDGLFWIWNCPVFCWDCSFWAILKWLMECEPSTKYGHSHQKRGCFSKKKM